MTGRSDELRRERAHWLWTAYTGGGQGITDADIDERFIADARQPMYRDAATLRRHLSNAALRGAELLTSYDDGDVIIHVGKTRSGLRLDLRTAFDVDARIATAVVQVAEGGSTSAVASASLRAAHHEFDEPRILDDPLAKQLAGELSAPVLAAVAADPAAFPVRWLMAIRSRFAEDAVRDAFRDGHVDQCVILGAGLDSFAYRNTIDQLHVYEVDHPASQTWKRKRLEACDIAIPDNVRFAPCDFEVDDFMRSLTDQGFQPGRPATVLWLGVVWYLTQDAIDHTLARLGSLPSQTSVIFDHVVPRGEWGTAGADRESMVIALERGLTLNGEPWLSLHDGRTVVGMLRSFRLDDVETLDSARCRSVTASPATLRACCRASVWLAALADRDDCPRRVYFPETRARDGHHERHHGHPICLRWPGCRNLATLKRRASIALRCR